MVKQCIITIAITGAVPKKEDNPALPITPSEQIESTHEAYEAGASLVHIHVRNADQSSSSDPQKFAEIQQGVQKHCPGMIVQFSTGGRGREMDQRGAMLYLKPDMASLATGSVNFPNSIYENPPDFVENLAQKMLIHNVKPEIEIFDMAMLYNAADLVRKNLLKPPVHIQFVLGIPNALPARQRLLKFMIEESQDALPGSTWTAAGVGRHQFEVNQWCLELGGHCRTGLEDNLKISKDRLATSNAELVSRIVDVASDFGRDPATPEQARQILNLPPAA